MTTMMAVMSTASIHHGVNNMIRKLLTQARCVVFVVVEQLKTMRELTRKMEEMRMLASTPISIKMALRYWMTMMMVVLLTICIQSGVYSMTPTHL